MLTSTIILFLFQFLVVLSADTKTSSVQLQHFWNLFKLRDVFITAEIRKQTSGTLFSSCNDDKQFKISVDEFMLTIIFPENNGWHKRIVVNLTSKEDVDLMIILNDNNLLVFDNCRQIFTYQLLNIDLMLTNPKIKLFTGWKKSVPNRLEIGSGFPILQKCGKLDVHSSSSMIENIEKRFEEKSVNYNVSTTFLNSGVLPEGFDGCIISRMLIKIGESKIVNCTECKCVGRDNVMCRALECKKPQCSHSILEPGDCCPRCRKQCLNQQNHILHSHGEIFWPEECHRCECWDGNITCSVVDVSCKTPKCPSRDWITDSKYHCCPKCRDHASFCDMKPCHEWSDCYNEQRGAKCVCKEGFRGNGTYCSDINECEFSEDARAQLGGCMDGTQCINTMGSFECHCLPGFQRLSKQVCVPLLRV